MRGLAIGVALLVGCGAAAGSWQVDAATQRAPTDLACPRERLTAVYLGGGGVSMSGCGLRRTYTCVGRICAPDGPATGTYVAPSASATSAVSAVGDTDEVALARAALTTCALQPGTPVVFFVGVDGDVLRVDLPEQAAGMHGCAVQVLRNVAFADRSDAERLELVVHGAADPATPPTQAPTEIIPPPSTGADARARAAIDALHDAILACTGGTAIAVVADWSADGMLTVHLPDARAGTPEDGCVRAATSGAHLDPAPGVAGSVLHPLH